MVRIPVACLALLCLTNVCWSAARNDAPGRQELVQLAPRALWPKDRGVIRPPQTSGRLQVKFVDSMRARPQNGRVISRNGVDCAAIDQMCADLGVTFIRAINKTELELAALENRAAVNSGQMQPDLASIMYVQGPMAALEVAAEKLQAMELVEFVAFDPEFVAIGADPSCQDPGAAGNCITATPGTPFCTDEDCCELVGEYIPYCTDVDAPQGWDIFCVNYAHLFCQPPVQFGGIFNRCSAPLLAGSCLEAHPNGGCQHFQCCTDVCALDDFCCVVVWDALCVLQTQSVASCQALSGPTTPNLALFQGHLTPGPYLPNANPLLNPYVQLGLPFPPVAGFGGEGYNLRGVPDSINPYDGLYGLGQQLLDEFFVGSYNGAKGQGVRVGVIEFGAYVNHEDLNVHPEPGQTIITIPLLTAPDHGTACLGIIGALDNGLEGPESELGCLGVAPEAELWFFPTTSIEEGPRLLSAITSALQRFGTGDILSFSIGPAGACGTLISTGAERTLIALGTSLGITSFIAAGNSCCNLSSDDFGLAPSDDPPSGAAIIGAVTPGRPFCRLGFSNHSEVGATDIDGSAWGTRITTLGYGDYFDGGPPERRYTTFFGGTSGATPMFAAGMACMQGLAKQFFGIPITPGQLRNAVTLIFQCENPNPEDLPGAPEPACSGDFDPDEEPNWVVGMLDLEATAASMISFGGPPFDESPHIQEFFIRRGKLLFGNIFSIKASDNSYLSIKAERATPSTGGSSAPGLAPSPPTTLGGFGLVTDMEVRGQLGPALISALTLRTEARTTTAFTTLMFVEMYNWLTNKFDFINLTFLAAVDTAVDHPVAFPDPYVRVGDKRFVIRLWTVAPGNPSMTIHAVQHDFVGITAGPVFGGGGTGP